MEKNNCAISGVPYVSVWDGGVEVATTCTIDLATGNILDIKQTDVDGLDVCEREYIVLNDEQVDVLKDDDGVPWVRLEGAQRDKLLPGQEDSDRTYVVTEWCGNCENEVEIHGWDTDRDGFQAFCPHCGKPLMLCDECNHAPDYRGCNWSDCAGCYRQPGGPEPADQTVQAPKPAQADQESQVEAPKPAQTDQEPQAESPRLRMETPLGTLVARHTTDPDYPGIELELVRPGCEVGMPVALVEYCSADNADTDLPEIAPELITRVWGDAMNEDYTERVVHDHIEEFFKEDGNPAPLTRDEIIAGLKDLIKDRKSFFGDNDEMDASFRYDAKVLQTAVELLEGKAQSKTM